MKHTLKHQAEIRLVALRICTFCKKSPASSGRMHCIACATNFRVLRKIKAFRKWDPKSLPKFEGKCTICLRSLDQSKANLDHEHGSMRVRGWLCYSCNTGLGKFNDDPKILKRAAKYIEDARVKAQELKSPLVMRTAADVGLSTKPSWKFKSLRAETKKISHKKTK